MVISVSVAVIYGFQENTLKDYLTYALTAKAPIGTNQEERRYQNDYKL